MPSSEENCDDIVEPEDQNVSNVNVKTKEKKGWTRFYITVEPIKFCMGFTVALTAGVTIDLLERNVCFRKYNMSFSECTSKNVSTEIKADVEAMTAEVNMINNVIQGICPMILVLFIGPWSDVNGRKPFILLAFKGFLVYYFLWAVFSFFPYMPVIYFFIPSVPLGLTGGVISVYVCTWSYVTDNFETDERTFRFTLSNSAYIAGTLVGNASAEQILLMGGDYGFQSVFFVSFSVALFGYLYTVFVVEETIICESKKRGRLLDIKHVKSMIDTVILKPKGGHLVIALVLLVLMTEIPAYAGDEAVTYLVGKSHYDWSLGKYNLYAAISSFVSAYVPVIIVWIFMEKCGMSNSSILAITAFVVAILLLARVLSVNETMFWVLSILTKCCSIIGPCIDSELVDTVAEDNVGKAFTFTSMLDALSPLVAIPLYTLVYTQLLPDKTIYVYFVTYGLACVTLIASLGLFIILRKSTYARPPGDAPANEHEAVPAEETSPLSA